MRVSKNNLCEYFWLFIMGSVFGWFLEGAYSYLIYHKLINHTCLVIGPFNMIYGLGAVVLTAVTSKFKDNSNFKLFVICFVSGTLIEYISSFFMERLLGFVSWDYSNRFLNINGRVCLLMSILWGGLGIFWVRIIYPFIKLFFDKINYNNLKKIMLFLIFFLIFDIALTCSAVVRANNLERGIAPQNKYEEFLDKTFNKAYLKNMFNDKWHE